MNSLKALNELLPGNTVLPSEEYQECKLTELSVHTTNKKIIVLASNSVNDTTLFINGLTQNILILYDLFESIGFTSYILQQEASDNADKKEFIGRYRTITNQHIIQNKIAISYFIEIGLSIDSATRGFFRKNGCKMCKLYLGNILNIDIETIQYLNPLFFNHHMVGELDEIWTSPHYNQHLDYATVLNRVTRDKGKVVPYVWDSCFITEYGVLEEMRWKAPADWKTMDIVLVDPNISFQKCSFYSILLIEALHKKYPEWIGKVYVVNGDKLKLSMKGFNSFLPSLDLFRSNRIVLQERKPIHTIIKEHPSACFITHQWNNDYNYLTLELMYCGYPILHNSVGWAPFGYYYDINKWDVAIETLYKAIVHHSANSATYKSHATNLIWKHSIHNPHIQSQWSSILDSS
jgi:hypothetical protein